MKVGDLVKHKYGTVTGCGIVLYIDNSHRQETLIVLFNSGIIGPVWVNHLEKINENR